MNKRNSTILICAGGTGGHVIPALAVANSLRNQGYIVHWLGTKAGLETKLVSNSSIPISYISISGLRGGNWLTVLVTPFKVIIALIQSMKILLKLRPALVIGMGGFVTGPSGLAAWLLRIPLIIHEQNAIPGTTNRILAKLANKVLEGFPNSFTKFKHILFTGNPIRNEFLNLPPPTIRFANNKATKLKLLVVGGSRGALAINECIPYALQQCFPSTLDVWHQTGQNHLDKTIAIYQQVAVTARVVPFIDDMVEAYAWADLVVCRAGAITIAEIAAAGIASVLVPFPFATDDHQTKNAEYLRAAAAAIIIPQRELTAAKLAAILQDFINNRDKLITMGQAAYNLANRNALNNVVKQCLTVINRH
jgi:UDP-N-acetylglucosamine--N-acetylmuramyl-(pentapeptide) pyrophosphoryl-undecaprenol N-acetylglucosamine transferase